MESVLDDNKALFSEDQDDDELVFFADDEDEKVAEESLFDDELSFVSEEAPAVSNENIVASSPKKVIPKPVHPKWRVVIADDEADIHSVTKMVLGDYSFLNRELEFLHAYTGKETQQIMAKEKDVAIILLDVVMESDDAGLQTAKYIREVLGNSFVRIILRTGQPGKAPEKQVILDYDINEYKNKAELTTQKLFTTVTAALRSYKDIRTIERSRRGLEQMIKASSTLFEIQSLKQFTQGVLHQLISLLNLNEDSMYIHASGLAISQKQEKFVVLATTGVFEKYQDKVISDAIPLGIKKYIDMAIKQKKSLFVDDVYVGYFCTRNGSVNILYLDDCSKLIDLDKDLINIFSTNVAIAFDNIYLNQEIVDTQKEVIYTLGEVVETRSKEAAKHVIRVAEFCYLLAELAAVDTESAELLRLSAPMHDVGKIGIPDSILNKPAKLNDEEYELMKTHTTIGYDILKKSNREIIKTASIVAHEHHERWDGRGYPRGKKGKDIHIFGRICAIADVFDALSHKRVYKEAWEKNKLIALFKEEKGKQFDPDLTDFFLENIDKFYAINDRFPEEYSYNRSNWGSI